MSNKNLLFDIHYVPLCTRIYNPNYHLHITRIYFQAIICGTASQEKPEALQSKSIGANSAINQNEQNQFLFSKCCSTLPTLFHVRIIRIENSIWNYNGQLIYIHEEPPQVFSGQSCHVNYLPVVSEDPKVARVDSLKTVTTEGARL